MKLNSAQRRHLASTFNAVGLGHLAFFGYHEAQSFHFAPLAASLLFAAVLEGAAGAFSPPSVQDDGEGLSLEGETENQVFVPAHPLDIKDDLILLGQ